MGRGAAARLFGYSSISWIGAIIGIIIVPMSTRFFLPEDLGKINLFISTSTIFYCICLLGFDQGFMRFFFDFKEKEEGRWLYAKCVVTSILAFVLLSLVCMLASPWLSSFIAGEKDMLIVPLLLLVVASQIALRYSQTYWRAADRLIPFAVLSLSMIALMKFCYFFGGVVSFDFMSGAFSLAIFAVAFILLSLLFTKDELFGQKKKPSNHTYARLLKYSLPIAPAVLLSTANGYIPMYAVRAIADLGEVGVYSMAVTLTAVISVFSSGINSFWPPYVFKNYKTKQKSIQVFHQALVLVLSFLVISVMSLQDAALLFLGEGYLEAASYFPFLLIAPFAYAVGETAGVGIHIAKKSKYSLLTYLVGITSNIFLSFGLTKYFGVVGAAAAAAISAILMLVIKTHFGEREYQSVGSYRYMGSSLSVMFALALAKSVLGLSSFEFFFACVVGFALVVMSFGKKDLCQAWKLLIRGVRDVFFEK